jgi:endonuclease/exonuclease/phosphatase family metal-dependent hydrolase
VDRRLKPALEKIRKDMRSRPTLKRFPEREDEQFDRLELITQEELPDTRIERVFVGRTLELRSYRNCEASCGELSSDHAIGIVNALRILAAPQGGKQQL